MKYLTKMQLIGLDILLALSGSACSFDLADGVEEVVSKLRLNVDESQMAELLELTSRAGRKIGAGLGSIQAMPDRPEQNSGTVPGGPGSGPLPAPPPRVGVPAGSHRC